MSSDWKKWLTDEEIGTMESNHDGQEYMGLYLIAMEKVAYTRERLAKGMLYNVSFDDLTEEDFDYIIKTTSGEFDYDSEFGDNKECKCGHVYYRHFDTYDDMDPVGCKYCDCFTFKEK